MVQPPTVDMAAKRLFLPPLICSWLWKKAWIGLGTISLMVLFTGAASMRKGLFGRRGKRASGLPSGPKTISSFSGWPSWSSCVACSAVALATPSAPGNRP